MRRGHRLHSIAGAGSDLDMRRFASSLPETESRSRLETRLVEAVMNCDIESLKQLQQECSSVRVDQKLMEDLVIECVGLANKDLLVVLVDLLATDNMYSYEVSPASGAAMCCFSSDSDSFRPIPSLKKSWKEMGRPTEATEKQEMNEGFFIL